MSKGKQEILDILVYLVMNEEDKFKRDAYKLAYKVLNEKRPLLKLNNETVKEYKKIPSIGDGIITRFIETKIPKSMIPRIQLIHKLIKIELGMERSIKLSEEYKTLNEVKKSKELSGKYRFMLKSEIWKGINKEITRKEYEKVIKSIKDIGFSKNVEGVGAYRRGNETFDKIKLLCNIGNKNITEYKNIQDRIKDKIKFLMITKNKLGKDRYKLSGLVTTKNIKVCKLSIYFVTDKKYNVSLLINTGSDAFIRNIYKKIKKKGIDLSKLNVKSEREIFEKIGMEYVKPELR